MGLSGQFARPHGVGGRLVGRMMARRHAEQVSAIVAEVDLRPGEAVLEIGFGPGIGLVALARAAAGGQVAGIDPSAVMVTAARRRVRRFGPRMDVREGTAAALPWDEAHFDAVCAINSVQLWQPRIGSMSEVLRVLKPGGRLVLGVIDVAVLPDLTRVGPDFDEVLIPELVQAGFTEVSAGWRPQPPDRKALVVRAVRPSV